MLTALLTLEIRYEQDIVLTRQRARHLAELLGFDAQDQTRIATATSEIARNAFQYARGGRVEFHVQAESPATFLINIRDQGPGITNLKEILAGRYTSPTGLGLGLINTQRLMEHFEIESSKQGTSVLIGKKLPIQAPVLTKQRLAEIAHELLKRSPQNPFEEIQQQNQELLRALEELRQREEQLTQLNQELEDTNRGVVALYAELDEKADSLRRANELKTRFLSNMSHEFRTPLNSIVSLSRLLLDRLDGELTTEQEKQVIFIRKAAEGLSELVNDLLDLAKVEAGKTVVYPSTFEVSELFATLRGMLRPLLAHNSSINLIFEEPINIPTLYTDEGKVAQILRNFISNALKYTEQGEVRIWAACHDNAVILSVTDTGIGIAPQDQERMFEDFVQIESHLQKRVKGTGLGLPLSRKLAELLGGHVLVTSTLGTGSTFSVSIPLASPEMSPGEPKEQSTWQLDSQKLPILLVEDHAETLFTYEKYLENTIYQAISAQTLDRARQVLEQVKPAAIVLDILLEGQSAWTFLSDLKEHPATQDIPILVITVVDNEKQAIARGADQFLIKPVDRLLLLNQLNTLVKHTQHQTILLIDDDPVARYLLKQYLSATPFKTLEAGDGAEGLHLAHTENLSAIILDLALPKLSGVEVLNQLKLDSVTSHIPIIINTSQPPNIREEPSLVEQTVAILSKDSPSQEEAIANLRAALVKAGLSWESEGAKYG